MNEDQHEVTYEVRSKAEVLEHIDHINILVLTATAIESESLHERMHEVRSPILKVGIDNFTYFIGRLGNYDIVHVQCKAGSATSSGSSIVTAHAISVFNPKMVVMVGIAFGINKKNQKIGDVLVSEMLAPYELQRLGKDQVIHRGSKPQASLFLSNRFTNHKWKYEYSLDGEKLVSKVIAGLLLSGEKLIDNASAKKLLIRDFPEAIGGEMEGCGVAIAAEQKKTDWLIVKAICDFADGNKGSNKKLFQKTAAKAAVGFCASVFSEPHIFAEMGVSEVIISLSIDKALEIAPVLKNQDCFDLFNPVHSDSIAYIHRSGDVELIKNIETQNGVLYLRGPNSIGKTSMIFKGLSDAKAKGFKICYITFQSFSSDNLEEIMVSVIKSIAKDLELPQPDLMQGSKNTAFVDIIRKIKNPSVIAFDEIDSIFHLKNKDKFFMNIRSTQFDRYQHDVPVVFVLSTVNHPVNFIEDPKTSPFNIGKEIEIENFSLVECDAHLKSLFPVLTSDEIKNIWEFTAGFPLMINYAVSFLYEGVPAQEINSHIEQKAVELKFLKRNFDQEKATLDNVISSAVGDKKNKSAAVEWLMEQGIIEETKNGFRFSSPLIERLYILYS